MANPEFKPGKNKKAGIFEAYMKTNELSYFKRRDVHDGMDTVAFITALPAGGNHRLVAAVLTNNSMYSLLRVHLGLAPAGPEREKFLEFIRRLNMTQSVFKYLVEDDNNAFLDVCITTRPDHFEPEVIRTTLNLIIYHMKDHYDEIARHLAKPGDETDGFDL